jgi:16S rRNA (guanine1207-N2)-methyltransferase
MAQGRHRTFDESSQDYRRYRERAFHVRDQTFRVVTKPGVFAWERLDRGTRLLIEAMDVCPADRVLDLGCGCGILGLAAAGMAPQGRVTLVDSSVVAVEAARRTLALNGVTHADVHLSDAASAVRDVAFDVVVTHLPRGKAIARQFIADAAAVLKPDGRLYLAGHKRAGIKPFVTYAQEVFGNGEVIALKKGYRVAVCVKDEDTTVPHTDYYRWHEFSAQVDGRAYRFVSKPGVFSWNELDAGTRVLVETMSVRPGDTALDLGCGCGIIGLIAAHKASQGRVCLTDSSVVAVEAARRTLALNGVTNAEVHLSDGAAAVREVPFDVVITNPPFHQGRKADYNVAHQFIRDAACVLQRRGRLYVVANRFIRYEGHMSEHFHQVSVAYEDNLYRVLLAVRPKKARGKTRRRKSCRDRGPANLASPQGASRPVR